MITVSGVSCKDAQHLKVFKESAAGETANSSEENANSSASSQQGHKEKTFIETLYCPTRKKKKKKKEKREKKKEKKEKKEEFHTPFLHFPQVTEKNSHSTAGSLAV